MARTSRARSGAPDRYGRGEDTAGRATRLEPHVAAVRLRHPARDGQPEAGAAGRAPGIEAHESIEHAIAILLGNTRSRVGDADQHVAVLARHRDRDRSAARRIE